MISQRAIKSLPSKLQPFYLRHGDEFDRLSVYPDIRRFNNDDEASRHYVDMERLPGETIPHTYEDAVAHYGRDILEHAGYVPWHVQQVYGELVKAFRNKQYRRILFKSGTLSHYLADAHVPLHTTENYDGQLTGDTGAHSRFESDLIELFPGVIEENYEPAGYVGNVPWRTIKIVRSSHELVPKVLQGDRRNQYADRKRDGYSLAKARETYGGIAARRLNDASHMVASFWYTAWVDAGRPDLPDARFSDVLEEAGTSHRSTGRSVTYYEGEWTGRKNWSSEVRRHPLQVIRKWFRMNGEVRLATVDLSENSNADDRLEVEIHEAGDVQPDRLQDVLRRKLHPMNVEVEISD